MWFSNTCMVNCLRDKMRYNNYADIKTVVWEYCLLPVIAVKILEQHKLS